VNKLQLKFATVMLLSLLVACSSTKKEEIDENIVPIVNENSIYPIDTTDYDVLIDEIRNEDKIEMELGGWELIMDPGERMLRGLIELINYTEEYGEGEVWIQVKTDTNGYLKEYKILKSTNQKIEEIIIKAADKFKFESRKFKIESGGEDYARLIPFEFKRKDCDVLIDDNFEYLPVDGPTPFDTKGLLDLINYTFEHGEGEVVIEVEVGINGLALDYEILRSTNADLEKLVIDAIMRYEFEKFKPGGKATAYTIRIPFTFKHMDPDE
jgi:TonB family protein